MVEFNIEDYQIYPIVYRPHVEQSALEIKFEAKNIITGDKYQSKDKPVWLQFTEDTIEAEIEVKINNEKNNFSQKLSALVEEIESRKIAKQKAEAFLEKLKLEEQARLEAEQELIDEV